MKTTTLIAVLACILAAPVIRAQASPSHPVLAAAFRQQLQTMPPDQPVNVFITTKIDPALQSASRPTPLTAQQLIEEEALEKPVVDAIIAHGGVIMYASYLDGIFGATLSVKAVLDLANNPGIFDIEQNTLGTIPECCYTGPPIPGDTDGSGRITISDATMALRAAIGLIVLTPAQLQSATLGCGGARPTIADVTWILQDIVNGGRIPPFSCSDHGH